MLGQAGDGLAQKVGDKNRLSDALRRLLFNPEPPFIGGNLLMPKPAGCSVESVASELHRALISQTGRACRVDRIVQSLLSCKLMKTCLPGQ